MSGIDLILEGLYILRNKNGFAKSKTCYRRMDMERIRGGIPASTEPDRLQRNAGQAAAGANRLQGLDAADGR